MSSTPITREHIDKESISYEQFKEQTKALLDKGYPTSGDPNSDIPLLEFTELNLKRMERLDKTIELEHSLLEKLLEVPEKVDWVVLVEGWCGDVAQNLPVIAKMAAQSNNTDLCLLWRDQETDLIDHYLTNGGRSIPKLIALQDDGLKELGTWGPRPEPVQEMIMEFKQKNADKSKKEMIDELHEKMHKWYAKDKGMTIQNEFRTHIENWNQELLGQGVQ